MTLQKRPEADPFVAALATVTVVCTKMLQSEADKARGIIGVDALPSQVRSSAQIGQITDAHLIFPCIFGGLIPDPHDLAHVRTRVGAV